MVLANKHIEGNLSCHYTLRSHTLWLLFLANGHQSPFFSGLGIFEAGELSHVVVLTRYSN